MNFNSLRPFLAALLAPLVTSLAGYLAVHYEIQFSTDQQHQMVEAVVSVVIPAMLAINAVIRTTIDKKVNPSNSASTHLAVEGKQKVEAVKAAERVDDKARAIGLPPYQGE